MTILGGGLNVNVVYPTAQQVANAISDDFLQRIAPEDPVVLNYIDRAQKQLLRASRWQFLLSPVQSFVTAFQRNDYWIGPVGTGPLDTIDTGLNILNIGPIKTSTFFDRTNNRILMRTKEAILADQFQFRDGSSRQGVPRAWRCDVSTPNTINLYPAPDNQNNFQPVPESPACSTAVGGVLPGRLYFIRTTFVDSAGNESSASVEQRIWIPADMLLVVQPPQEIPNAASGILYNHYNVYVFNGGTALQQTTGQETLATPSPLNNQTVYTEPATGFLTGGVNYPTANNVEIMGGYLIQFRYFAAKPTVTTLAQFLVIPMDYFDVVVAGVNMFLARFLRQELPNSSEDITYWQSEFQAGITGMIRDKNLFPRAPEYISPDPSSLTRTNWYGYETWDEWYMPTS